MQNNNNNKEVMQKQTNQQTTTQIIISKLNAVFNQWKAEGIIKKPDMQRWVDMPHPARNLFFKEHRSGPWFFLNLRQNYNCPWDTRKAHRAGLDPVECHYFILGYNSDDDKYFIHAWDGHSSWEQMKECDYEVERNHFGKETPFGGWYGFDTEESAILFCENWMSLCHDSWKYTAKWNDYLAELKKANKDFSEQVIDDHEYGIRVTEIQWGMTKLHEDHRMWIDRHSDDARLASQQGTSYPPIT